jgi:hypothetical protein
MDCRTDNVVRIKDYLPPPTPKQKSQYELYPLPFFNRKALCVWDAPPTGNYAADCETGRAYAIEFLKSCDGTNGWRSLLPQIVMDMIRAGPTSKNSFPKASGIVVGFMDTIAKALM